MNQSTDRASALALVGIEKVWSEVQRTPFVQRDLDAPIDRLPDISEGAVAARSFRAADALAILDRVQPSDLPHDLALTHAVAQSTARRMAQEEKRYWLAFDPLGVGFFALFAATAYGGGFLLNTVSGMLSKQRFESLGDLDRYLGLVEDYARLIDQMRERTTGQASRGIRMPWAQLSQSVQLINGLRANANRIVPSKARLAAVGADASSNKIMARIKQSVEPAFVRLLGLLEDPDFKRALPEKVGICQYPGGEMLYRELVREHTTLDISPEEVHAKGVAQIACIRAEMCLLLKEAEFEGSAQEYLAQIARNPSWRADGADAISSVFRRYGERIEPHINASFRFRPNAAYDVAPLPDALAGSMTFGFYDPPSREQSVGRYFFNVGNLAGGPLGHVAALNYHELVPGHHFHLASQRENESLHPLRANAFFNAFNEGWAEYAATLAGELGMYQTPEERFGRLVMDAFLTCRLVVDTGMNALGWDLERARSYMRENAFMPEPEIRSESIRYSCDMPAQALAYKLGEHFLIDQREAMRARLGEAFDIRDFHDSVLRPGALPLPLVARNIEAAIGARRTDFGVK